LELTELARDLNRSYGSVATFSHKVLRLKKPPSCRWTEEEEKFLKENYLEFSDVKLANLLNKTACQVRNRRLMLDLIKPRNPSSLEQDFANFLDDLGIKYETQVKIWKYKVDFLIGTKVIETHGTYWHCDPRIYSKGPINKIQKKNIQRDKRKKEYLTKKRYSLLVIWEKDFYENRTYVKQKLGAFLGNKIEKLGKIGESPGEDNTEVTDRTKERSAP
jgi:G:T-mismatch repair DNA endonuclease (very short patch repair protein)